MLFILILLLIIIGAISNSIMDTIRFRFSKSKFSKLKGFWYSWFEPNSWKHKWKFIDGKMIIVEKPLWYYLFLFNPGHKEKFPYSSTFLVFLTDAWHFFKSLMFLCFNIITLLLIISLISLSWWQYALIFISIIFLRGVVFELFWNKIWKIKK